MATAPSWAVSGALAPAYLARVPVRCVGKTTYVRVEDIMWISAADYYAELHTTTGKTILVRETMQRLELGLDPREYCRIHRSAIIRLDWVAEVKNETDDRQVLRLRDGTKLLVGHNRRDALQAALRAVELSASRHPHLRR